MSAVATEDRAAAEAVQWLREHQAPDGWWCGEMSTNATMTAEHVLLCRFLGLDTSRIREGAVRHLLEGQREDGSWALYFDGPADLSTTIESYAALKVLGHDPASREMARALRVVHRLGGVVRARIFTKMWLALFGAYPWRGVPSMPPELIHLPAWAPLNLYDFSCWARGTIAPLLIVLSRKPMRPLGVSLDELVASGTEAELARPPGSGAFWWLDQLQKLYEALPWQPGRAVARRRVVGWIVERQEADGSWGGIQPPWVYSLIALHLEGMPLDHPILRRGIDGLQGFAVEDEHGWRLQACMSPVWDTAWALRALSAAGVAAEDEMVVGAVRWLLREQIPGRTPGIGTWPGGAGAGALRTPPPTAVTGASAGPSWRTAEVGPSSLRTMSTRTSTTRRWWSGRCAKRAPRTPATRSRARSGGAVPCARATAPGPRSTATTPRDSCTASRLATSGR